MNAIESRLAEAFRCRKRIHSGAQVEKLAISGMRISRLLEVLPFRYRFVSSNFCGYTETCNLTTLQGKDDLGNLVEILFAD